MSTCRVDTAACPAPDTICNSKSSTALLTDEESVFPSIGCLHGSTDVFTVWMTQIPPATLVPWKGVESHAQQETDEDLLWEQLEPGYL